MTALIPFPCQSAQNLHFETENHFFELHHFGFDRLVVTFEDARLPKERPQRYRQGWGVAPFLKRSASVLAVKPKQCHWYSKPDLAEAFAALRPFLTQYGQVVTYGMSMGGFAALSYADLLGASRVVAMAPQSTYRFVGTRRETRFPASFDWDHSGPQGDAVTGCKGAEVFLLYDRMERTDKWHAHRFQGANIHRIALPYFSHGVPRMLLNIGALGMVVDLVLTGEIDEAALYRLARQRREWAQYQTFLKAKARQHPAHTARVYGLLGEEFRPDPKASA